LGGGFAAPQETVINNYYGDANQAPAADPWGGSGETMSGQDDWSGNSAQDDGSNADFGGDSGGDWGN
jgi:hypothetical protein